MDVEKLCKLCLAATPLLAFAVSAADVAWVYDNSSRPADVVDVASSQAGGVVAGNSSRSAGASSEVERRQFVQGTSKPTTVDRRRKGLLIICH